MTPDLEAAIEAAAYAMDALEHRQPAPPMRDMARAAIEAAMPAIRESIAQEIEAHPAHVVNTGLREAARIVRGGAA